jgi:CBS domain-containing protein
MVACPIVHGPQATVGELRDFFTDDHVHAALLVDRGELIGVVERPDLPPHVSGGVPARTLATLNERTISPSAGADETFGAMKRTGRRRLAVVSTDGVLAGLLCLKASGRGFCSDADVRSRRAQQSGGKRPGRADMCSGGRAGVRD